MTFISLPLAAQQNTDCIHEKAFGRIKTSSGEQLGDFCVDRSTGSITGPFSVSGLTLTMDDGVNFTFEDLKGNSQGMMQIAPVLSATYHNGNVQDQSPEINVLADGEFFQGFIYHELAGPSELAPSFVVSVADLGSILETTYVGFEGEAKFSGDTAHITLIDSQVFGTSKGTDGAIEVSVAEDGTVTGSGSFKTQNIRSAGYSKNEWVSMDVTIDDMRGFATGPTGQVIKSYALVTADIVDAEGDNRQSKGVLEIFLFDPNIWE